MFNFIIHHRSNEQPTAGFILASDAFSFIENSAISETYTVKFGGVEVTGGDLLAMGITAFCDIAYEKAFT